MKDVTPARFSLFAAGINKPSSQRPYKQGTLEDVYCWMNSMKMMQLTEQLRGIKDEKEQKLFKASFLPFATFSGTFAYRNQNGLLQHSGLLCFDFDTSVEMRIFGRLDICWNKTDTSKPC